MIRQKQIKYKAPGFDYKIAAEELNMALMNQQRTS